MCGEQENKCLISRKTHTIWKDMAVLYRTTTGKFKFKESGRVRVRKHENPLVKSFAPN